LDVDCRGGEVSHVPRRRPTTAKTAGYFIPNDNPFVGRENALEEFYAIGLRNPWRMSFDRQTGQLYVTDPGDRRREEINLVRSGSNCGWNYAEGSLARRDFLAQAPKRPKTYLGVQTMPLFEYSRDAAHRCVIGGHVYRGSAFPELVGKYVYADQSGRVYALELTENGQRAGKNTLIAVLPEPGIGISSLGEDAAGELYFCAIGELATETGQVYRLRQTDSHERSQLPETLADTGLFQDWQRLKPKAGVAPYEVNMAFWSDGAEKRRWIAVPEGRQVRLGGNASLKFPVGTVFVKHFELPTDASNPKKTRPLETRVLVCDDRDQAFGVTYRWSKDGASTRQVVETETEEIEVSRADGRTKRQTWIYPGRMSCAMCHNEASGYVLGFNLKQIHREVTCPDGSTANQVEWLRRQDVLSGEVCTVAPEQIPRLVSPTDQTATLTDRVRSYLDVNCAVCHNPKTRFAAFDARLERDPNEQGIVDGMSYHHATMGTEVRIVKPGDAGMSALLLRVGSADPVLRMPPLGSTVVDRQAEQLIRAWIESLAKPVPQLAERPTQSEANRR
jgi:uncharacterized repeat protein (TIGR03806 family)